MTKNVDPASRIDEVVRRILIGPKYRHLDENVVRRFAGEAVERVGRTEPAVKYAKRKLHQAFGAFMSGSPAQVVRECVDTVKAGRADLRTACRAAMRAHASTTERSEHVEDLYTQVATWTGPVTSIADLACGLNPLAIPWMNLAPGAHYWCCDIDWALQSALTGLGEILPVAITSETCDLVAQPPKVEADLVLLLKTLTTLEQQRAGATTAVLRALRSREVVLSVPGRSLSGRHTYARDPLGVVVQAVTGTVFQLHETRRFGDEVVCHLVADGDAAGSAGQRRA